MIKSGLIVFAGEAYTQLPITSDYNSAKLFLEAVNTQIVPRQGTAIGAAINLAMRSFTPAGNANKAIVLLQMEKTTKTIRLRQHRKQQKTELLFIPLAWDCRRVLPSRCSERPNRLYAR
jgi:hypothetical protein